MFVEKVNGEMIGDKVMRAEACSQQARRRAAQNGGEIYADPHPVLVAHPAGVRGEEYHSEDKGVKKEPQEERREGYSADETALKPKITIAFFGLENRRRYEKKGEYDDVSEVSFKDVMEECRGNVRNFDFNSKRHRKSLYQRYRGGWA